ncbi:transposable element Tc1 transposase [Trichonephila clavipes]|nr:transposable element Tc1 transposase [Trichonephila clavipes]
MHKCEARSVDCSTGLYRQDCSNGIIVYYSPYYNLFHTYFMFSLRLVKARLRSQKSLRRAPLTPQHRRNRLQWQRSHSSWLPSDLHRKVSALNPVLLLIRSSLVILHTTLTVQRYAHTILQPVVFPLMARHPVASFQQDNARPYTTRISLDYLCALNTLSWPASSPDFSPVEHVWNMLAFQIQEP